MKGTTLEVMKWAAQVSQIFGQAKINLHDDADAWLQIATASSETPGKLADRINAAAEIHLTNLGWYEKFAADGEKMKRFLVYWESHGGTKKELDGLAREIKSYVKAMKLAKKDTYQEIAAICETILEDINEGDLKTSLWPERPKEVEAYNAKIAEEVKAKAPVIRLLN